MDDNKLISSHLDYLSSYQKVKDFLSSSDCHDFTVESESFSSLLKGDSVSYSTERPYLCPVFFLDKKNGISYPFLIFKVKRAEDSISFFRLFPLINPLVLEIFETEGIQMDSSVSWGRLKEMIASLTQELEQKKLVDTYQIVYGFASYSSEIVPYISIYPFLAQFLKTREVDQKYQGLFQDLNEEEFEKQIAKDSLGFFSRIDHALLRLRHYHSAKVSYQGKTIVTGLVYRLLDDFVKHGENVLFFVPSSEYEELVEMIKDSGCLDFLFSFGDYSLDSVLSMIGKEDYHQLTKKEEEKMASYDQKVERYLSFYQKKEECFSSFQKNVYPDSVEYLAKIRKGEALPLFITDYTEEEYKKDDAFLSSFSSYPKVLSSSSYVKNPFYGLSISPERENYDYLQLLFVQFSTDMERFFNALHQSQIFLSYGISVFSFTDFERVRKSFRILSEYNGFPKKYFHLNQEGQRNLSLTQLKLRYQAVSSSKLLVTNLMKEEILMTDIPSLLHLYDTGNFYQKWKVKKILKSFLKKKKGSDFDTIVRILSSYTSSQKELERVLPDYEEIYGENIKTMNGVMEIESNIRYIQKFEEYSKQNPAFSLDHPFVRRYFKDKEFRLESQRQFREILSLEQEAEGKLDLLLRYFPNKNQREMKAMLFEEIINKIRTWQGYDYETFRQCLEFSGKLKGSSALLQDAFLRYDHMGKSLSSFPDQFRLGLVLSLYQKEKKSFAPYQKGYEQAKEEYLSSLKDTKEVKRIHRYQQYASLVMKEKAKYSPLERKVFLQRISQMDFDAEERQKFLRMLFSFAPISVASVESLPFLENDVFDHVVLFDSGLLTNEDLLFAYRLGKDVLLLNDRTLFDERTQGYHQTLINREVLYQKVFSFSYLGEETLSLLSKQYSLFEDERYPLLYQKENETYALLPDCLLTEDYDIHFGVELASYFAEQEDIVLEVVDTESLLMEEE